MQRTSITSLVVLAAAFALAAGCHSAPAHTLGAAFTESTPMVVQALSSRKQAAHVVVEGEMIEKCPVAGCWFVLKDRTGVVRVDTKSAGFVVSEVPLHTHLTVAGTVTPGVQPGIAATGFGTEPVKAVLLIAPCLLAAGAVTFAVLNRQSELPAGIEIGRSHVHTGSPSGEAQPSAGLCPWRAPDEDRLRFFPNSLSSRDETLILSRQRVELAAAPGPSARRRRPRPDRSPHPRSGRLSGVVVTRRVRGECGLIELVIAADPHGRVPGRADTAAARAGPSAASCSPRDGSTPFAARTAIRRGSSARIYPTSPPKRGPRRRPCEGGAQCAHSAGCRPEGRRWRGTRA